MYRTGIAFESQRYAQEGALLLAGMHIAGCAALRSSYDGDVLSRALAEALLGAVAMGDVDAHFPNQNFLPRKLTGLQILKEVAAIVRSRDVRIVNVDATIYGPKAKLLPAVDGMRSNLEDALGLPAERISVKVAAPEHAAGALHEDAVAVLTVAVVSSQPLP